MEPWLTHQGNEQNVGDADLDREAQAVIRHERARRAMRDDDVAILHRVQILARCRRKGWRYRQVHLRAAEMLRAKIAAEKLC